MHQSNTLEQGSNIILTHLLPFKLNYYYLLMILTLIQAQMDLQFLQISRSFHGITMYLNLCICMTPARSFKNTTTGLEHHKGAPHQLQASNSSNRNQYNARIQHSLSPSLASDHQLESRLTSPPRPTRSECAVYSEENLVCS